jgi:pyruvate kinase
MSVSQSSQVPVLAGGFIDLEKIRAAPDPHRRTTKIVATVGPACWDLPSLEALMDAGVNVARFNFSHGTVPGHAAVLERVRSAAKNRNRNVGRWQGREREREREWKREKAFLSVC